MVPLGRVQAEMEEEQSFGAAFFQNAQTVSGLPKPVEMVVNAVGIVKTSGSTYFPVLPAQVYNTHNGVRRLCPLPERVSFSSLGKIVEALADPGTPVTWRRHFFDHSPLPGAKIVNHVLMNPDDFMFTGYGEYQLLDDIREFSRLNTMIQKHVPKLAGTILPCTGAGTEAMLVSSTMGTTRTKPWLDGDITRYYEKCNPLGDNREYWMVHDNTQKQSTVSASSTEAEYMALFEAVRDPSM